MNNTDTAPVIVSPDRAIERLRARLQPGQLIYLILRHVSRRGTQSELAVVVCDRIGYPEDLTADVAAALAMPTGSQRGVLAHVAIHDAGTWLTHRLSKICGLDTPSTALKFQWL
jgi:hypothetical protein